MNAFGTYDRVRVTGDGLTGRIGTIVDPVDDDESGDIPSYWVELDPAPDEDDRPASEMTYPVRAEHLVALA